MSNDFAKAKSIFISAVEEHAPDQWGKYLDSACQADAELRRRVELLLQAHQGEDSFLDRGDNGESDAAIDRLIAERPGMVVGQYRLVQQIGDGGFGVVFLAEQDRPVRRRVALKVLKPGMDTRQVILRFEAERQALALMDHPNIAKVFDAGTTESGRPYFVMELVPGVPITQYCDQCNLTTVERLQLFILVCQAVQHAHQKGVIHRDIKPTNVLVAIQDGQPAPKIIDFGIAKAINQQLTEHTQLTAFAQIMGTPLYMSPEQAELSPLGVDTRSDVYSLGALLYELLTGDTPFENDRLRGASYEELRRIFREDEPPWPSARISTLAAELATTVAEHRRTDARRLKQTVRGELDWIVMKCLEKDRNRRYESAGSLARDIERYLRDEPVQACPPSMLYRLRKYIRRNKIAAAFVLLLLASVAALAVSNIQTRHNERRALSESAKAIATSNLLLAMLDSANPEQAKGSTYTVRELLDDFSAGFGDQLKDQPEAEAAVRATIGNAYRRLELFQQARPHLEAALNLRRKAFGDEHEKVAESLVDLAWNYLGGEQQLEGEKLIREALEYYEHHPTEPLPVIRALWRLECVLGAKNQFDDAAEVAQRALDIAAKQPETEYPEVASVLHSLAQVRIRQKNFPEAERLARQSVEIHRRVRPPQHPETAFALQKLGVALHSQGKSADAVPFLREALNIFQKHYGLDNTACTNCLANLKSALNALEDQAALEALAKDEADQAMRSDSPEYHVRLAGLLLKNFSTDTARLEEGRRLIRQAIEAYRQIAVDSPEGLTRRMKAARGYVEALSVCAAAPGFAGEVEEMNNWLTAELPQLLAAFPENRNCQFQTACLYRDWAYYLSTYTAYLPLAERGFRDSLALFEKISASDPGREHIWLILANVNGYLGDVLWEAGKREEADAAYQRSMALYDEHEAEIAVVPQYIITDDYARFAYNLTKADRKDEANEFIRKAASNTDRMTEARDGCLFLMALTHLNSGDETGYQDACAALVEEFGTSSNDQARLNLAVACALGPHAVDNLSVPLKQAEENAAKNPYEVPYFNQFVLGAVLYRDGAYERAARNLEDSIATFPANPRPGVGTVHFPKLFLAVTKWQQGQRDDARRLLAEVPARINNDGQLTVGYWHRRAMLDVLRREAEAMIEPQHPDSETPNKAETTPVVSLNTTP